MSSANSSHKAFMNIGKLFVQREKKSGLTLNLVEYRILREENRIYLCLYKQAVLDLTKMKKLSAGCHWIIHRELICSKTDHDQ